MLTDQQIQDLQYLVNSAGWRVMVEYIKGQINSCVHELESRNFNQLAEAAVLQGKIRAFRSILDYPRTRIEEYQRKAGQNNG